tara:strand:+ start:444 stop:1553 length:1110 start_codon:yes stop_codon:yes gene_type:complete
MSDERPNILLLMTDQQRGDALGIEGHPVLQTPYLDALAAAGARFRHAYSATPVCIPARRTLMAGQRAASHGVFMNYTAPLPGPTLPGELSKAGYQTHLVGKLHLSPPRKLYGFDSADWSDSPSPHPAYDDYERFLVESGVTTPGAGLAHGASVNGYTARPYHLGERFHFSNWCADRALSFLARRDPTMPFFLKVSFHQPHQPLTPPAAYWDRYRAMDIPPPPVADWSRVYETPQRGLPVNAWRVCLEPELQRQMQAGYYGCINHIDDQIGRILARIPPNTVCPVRIRSRRDAGSAPVDPQTLGLRRLGADPVPAASPCPAGSGTRRRRKCPRRTHGRHADAARSGRCPHPGGGGRHKRAAHPPRRVHGP